MKIKIAFLFTMLLCIGSADCLADKVLLEHWTERDVPGQCHLDAWGWHGAIWYQQTYSEGVDFDYFTDRIIKESYHWGANLLELYPTMYNPLGWPWFWQETGDNPRPETYRYKDDPDWSNETFRELNRIVHDKNMLIQWFCHPEIVMGKKHAPVFSDPNKIEQNLNAVHFLNSEFGNAAKTGWRNILDGYGHEHWFEDKTGKTAMAQWLYNPGQYTYSTWAWHPANEPQYLSGMMCATTWVLRGRDDQLNLPDKLGQRYLGYQADSRTYKAPEEVWGDMSKFGGGTWPDWIVKQVNDYFRRRLLAPGKPESSAIWWLGETSPVLPDRFRPYVYGCSMDPMRAAAAGPMRTTGLGGHMDMAEALGKGHGGTIDARFDFPAGGFFIQNNYLRLELDPHTNRTRLKYDPSHTAHFDNNSRAFILAEPFLSIKANGLDARDNFKTYWRANKLVEYANKRETYADWANNAYPSSIGKNSKSPVKIHLSGFFSPGNYVLKFRAVPLEVDKPTVFNVLFNNSFITGVAVTEKHQNEIEFSVPYPGDYDLELVAFEGGPAGFESFEILRSANKFQFCQNLQVIEPAGHLAAIRIDTAVVDEKGHCMGTAQTEFRLAADTPGLVVSHCSEPSSGEVFAYSCDFVNEIKSHGSLISIHKSEDHEFVMETDCRNIIEDSDGGEVTIIPDSPKMNEILYFALKTKSSRQKSPAALKQTLSSLANPPAVFVQPGSKGYSFEDAGQSFPLIKILRVRNSSQKPFYVFEHAPNGNSWWTFRGAQASGESPGTDLLRVYTVPGKTSRIVFDGFINDIVRPGWGSQYDIVLSDPVVKGTSARLTAKVMSLTPILFAPRLQFAKPVESISLNGRPWAYFENDIVFLPRIEGEYDIEVRFGKSSGPCLRRTQACINDCRYSKDAKTLTIDWQNVKWVEHLPEEQHYCATIEIAGMKIIKIDGGKIILSGEDMVNIAMTEPEVVIHFK